MSCPPKHPDPTQEEIAKMTAEIRRDWSDQTFKSRSGVHLKNESENRYVIPTSTAHVGIGEIRRDT